jgi:alanine racemase
LFQTSFIELSESAVRNNVSFIKSLLGEEVVFSAVVKGNAYGHGISNYCPLAYRSGIRHFSVFSSEEAYAVYESLVTKDFQLMIMGDIRSDALRWVIEKGVEFYVYEFERLESAISIAKELGVKAKIHIEVETGMNRTGFPIKDLPSVFKSLEENLENLEIVGLCSHFAGAESITNYKRIKDQFNRFKKVREIH